MMLNDSSMFSFTQRPLLHARTLSTDSIFTVGSTTSSDATSSSENYPRRGSRYFRHTSPPPKVSSGQILIRARNANVPELLRQAQKRNLLKKQKTKSREQLEAEERRMQERKAELEDDPLLDASKMHPHKVFCVACDKYIQIDSRRQYYATLWYKHRSKRHGGVEMHSRAREVSPKVERVPSSPVALAAPLIDDDFACLILADMYSRTRGLRLLSLAAEALS